MGIEIHFLGEINIPEEHRTEYARQALQLLRAGGMVTVEPVQLYGHRLYLLAPPELDEEGRAVGHYNDLDENSGERWCLDAKEGWFGCGKIIGQCYYSTVAAVHVLTTLWSTTYAATVINGYLVREKPYIGWINHVLGTQHTNHRATQLWEIGRLLHLDNDYWVSHNPDLGYLMEDFPPECADREQVASYLAAYHFDELCSMLPPLTEEEWEELRKDNSITIQAIYNHLQNALRAYHQSGGTLEGAKRCLIMPTEEKRQAVRQKDADGLSLPFAFFLMPPAVSVACVAKEFGAAFWEIWDEIGAQIPESFRLTEPEPCPPVPPIPTQKFLDVAPEDLARDWTPEGGLRFSDEFEEEMAAWRAELDATAEPIAPQDFLKTLADNISAGGGLFFRDAFYELLSRQAEMRVQSAVRLLGRLAEREDEERRRFRSVLGNPALRRARLGF